jgi:hypothetical protein
MLDIYLEKTEKPKFDIIRIFRTDFNCLKNTNITQVSSLPPTRRLMYNMLPRAIWDLYIHGSRQILAVDFDLMLTKKRKDGYIPANTKYAEKFNNWENRFRLDSINGHDPFTQFEILKLMWDKGMFEPIGRTKEVLSMGLEEFATALTQTYQRG